MPLLPLKGVDQMVDEKPDARGHRLAWCEYGIKFHCGATVIRQQPPRARPAGAFAVLLTAPFSDHRKSPEGIEMMPQTLPVSKPACTGDGRSRKSAHDETL
jgi:hypothetical protein